ncbi:MAG: cytochrome c [Cytophagales bacterium]|nr:cytochrome c [Cytophagales bacterium]
MKNVSNIMVSVLMVITVSCSNEKVTPAPTNANPVNTNTGNNTNTTAVTYANVSSIFNSRNCTSCHGSGHYSGYSLNSYSNSKSSIEKNTSKFLKSIKHESGASPMPQGGSKMPDTEIKTIEDWINSGYVEK